MDNQNDPNSQNDLNTTPPPAWPPVNPTQPAAPTTDPVSSPPTPWATPDQTAPSPAEPTPVWTPPQANSQPASPVTPPEPVSIQPDLPSPIAPSSPPEPFPAPQPNAELTPAAPINPWTQALASNDNPTSQGTPDSTTPADTAPVWASTTQPAPSPEPQAANPMLSSIQPSAAMPENMQAAPDPAPTFTPPSAPAEPTTIPDASTPTSFMPTDNPWNVPVQQNGPDQSAGQPNWNTTANVPSAPDANMPPPTADSVPTDLSHLITNAPQPVPASAETLVVPATATPEVPNLPSENHKGIPMWLIGAGIGMLLLVIGASAYFILGVGQSAKQTTSLPATPAQPVSETKPAATVAPVAQASTQPTATGSASFGALQGESQSATGSSSIELARQRQGR